MSAGGGLFASLIVWLASVTVALPNASFGDQKDGDASGTAGGYEGEASVGEARETIGHIKPALRLSLDAAVQSLRWSPDRCYFIDRGNAVHGSPTTLSQIARDHVAGIPPVQLPRGRLFSQTLFDYVARPPFVKTLGGTPNRTKLPLPVFYHPLGSQIVIPTSSFSKERRHPVLGYNRPHLGQDYGIAAGCAIYAAHSGTVSMRGGAIVVTGGAQRNGHRSLWESRYYHVRATARLKPGQEVRAGDLIAHVKSRQRGTTGAHLHFELLKWSPELPGGWSQGAMGLVYRLPSAWAFIDPRLASYSTALPPSPGRLVSLQPDDG